MTCVNFNQTRIQRLTFQLHSKYGFPKERLASEGSVKFCKLIASNFRNTKNCDGMKNSCPRLKISLPRLRHPKTGSQRPKMSSTKTKTRKDSVQRQRCQSKTCSFTDANVLDRCPLTKVHPTRSMRMCSSR
jgi:hypothetical protein